MQHNSDVLRADVYRVVTEKIIAQIEAGGGTGQMPWHHDGSPANRPTNVLSKTFYRGINVVALWIAAQTAGYPTGMWATYRQWREHGAQVKKNEKGSLVVFWKKIESTEEPNAEGEASESTQRMIARGYWVFNAAQVDGYIPPELPELPESERVLRAAEFYARLGIDTRFGGDQAYYLPSKDYVQMPPFGRFRDAVAFYATILHEGSHATAAPHRLGRGLSGRFGSEAYAMEEMIADWASCLACMTLELSAEPRTDHAQYISSWLKVLKDDKRAVFTAASKAQEIVDWMWSRQPGGSSYTPSVPAS